MRKKKGGKICCMRFRVSVAQLFGNGIFPCGGRKTHKVSNVSLYEIRVTRKKKIKRASDGNSTLQNRAPPFRRVSAKCDSSV